jgi:putative glutamine amidotransferase
LSDFRPVIGLTTYLQQAQSGVWDVHATFLPAIYMEGVNLAGGTVVLLPPQPVEAADHVLDGLDGVITTGGRDMDPASYGQQRHPATDEPVQAHRDRDAWEAALIRGAQVMNVALGGTLHQHLPDVLGHTRHQQGNAVFSTSGVRTVTGTRLAALIGETSDVQCYHHQSIDRLGEGLIVSAQDSDGVIEAVEIPGENFVLAVQWHPEERLDDVRLFAGVVQAAAKYATGKVAPWGRGDGPTPAGQRTTRGKVEA